jgi:GT2 family glycosyltransferase
MPNLTPSISVVVVVFRHPASSVAHLLNVLANQTTMLNEVIVVDNAGDMELGRVARESSLKVRVINPGANVGYAQACNLAVAASTSDWVFFVNPDAVPALDVLKILLDAADESTALVGAQILLPGGEMVNAGDNPLHISGISWSGRYLEQPEHGSPRDVAVASGTALLVRRADFNELGGYHPDYFMYHDDVDLAWRSRMAGRRVLLAPRAIVLHEYEFDKGGYKWFWLERNRLWTILSHYEAKTLILLAPLLTVVELAILGQSVREGWWREKVRGWVAVANARGDLVSWRAHVQANRKVSDVDLVGAMTGKLVSPSMDAPGLAAASWAMERYRRWLILMLRALR